MRGLRSQEQSLLLKGVNLVFNSVRNKHINLHLPSTARVLVNPPLCFEEESAKLAPLAPGPPIDVDAEPYNNPALPGQYWVPGDTTVYERFNKLWGLKLPYVNNEIPIYMAEWPEGYEQELLMRLKEEGGMNDKLAEWLVEAARFGDAPDRSEVLIGRWRKFHELERAFPNFNLQESLLVDPKILWHRHRAVKLAMKRFQDVHAREDVGTLMPRLGRFIMHTPEKVASNMRFLRHTFPQVFNIDFTIDSINPRCQFLMKVPDAAQATLSILLDIFTAPVLGTMLSRDLSILSIKYDEARSTVKLCTQFFDAFPNPPDGKSLIAQEPGLLLVKPNILKKRLDHLSRLLGGELEAAAEAVVDCPLLMVKNSVALKKSADALAEGLELGAKELANMLDAAPQLLVQDIELVRQSFIALAKLQNLEAMELRDYVLENPLSLLGADVQMLSRQQLNNQ